MSRLESLRQKDKESSPSFLSRFEKELAESGGAVWANPVQINNLDHDLNDEWPPASCRSPAPE